MQPKLWRTIQLASGELEATNKDKKESEEEVDNNKGLIEASKAMQHLICKAFESSKTEHIGCAALEFIN